MTLLIGIDDAGRGPVLGPMVLAGVLIEEKDNSTLQKWGARDSKLLTQKKRGEIKEKIESQFKHHIEVTEPKEIDNSSNLNYLEAVKAAKIINKLTKNLDKKVKVVIDCPSVNIKSWSNDVQKLIDKPGKISLTCEHKADANHPSVSAASIIAKEKREDELYRLKLELKTDFGSGYPADPKTKEFITENYNNEKFKSIIRFSWNTVKKLIKAEKSNQQKLF
jgi:ribonuclease HII